MFLKFSRNGTKIVIYSIILFDLFFSFWLANKLLSVHLYMHTSNRWVYRNIQKNLNNRYTNLFLHTLIHLNIQSNRHKCRRIPMCTHFNRPESLKPCVNENFRKLINLNFAASKVIHIYYTSAIIHNESHSRNVFQRTLAKSWV